MSYDVFPSVLRMDESKDVDEMQLAKPQKYEHGIWFTHPTMKTPNINDDFPSMSFPSIPPVVSLANTRICDKCT